MAALLCLVAFSASCDGSSGAPATATPREHSATPAPVATSTPASGDSLASQIGPRGGLPQNDPVDLALRYGRIMERPPSTLPAPPEPQTGDSRDFIVALIDAGALAGRTPPQIVTVTATLLAKSEHAYFYVDPALGEEGSDVQASAGDFEETVWPAVTSVFGAPATPGIDGDPRMIVLHTDLGGVGGYYSSDDAYVRAVRPLSNEAEMVYMDATLPAGSAVFSVVLAHELQHLVHAKNDAGEEAWVNEGLSEGASGLVGGAVSSAQAFAARPETQLNSWDREDTAAHYGAGAAFFRYLAHRFGGDSRLGEVSRAAGDGPAGVDEFLAGAGQTLRFRDVFADWVAANILNRVEGPYANPEPVEADVEEQIAPGEERTEEVAQFGTDYWDVTGASGELEVQFEGAPAVDVLPVAATEGALFWSNAEDDIDTHVTREVDLTDAVDPVLGFRTWFDVEPWYDWSYVAVSTDGGATWRALNGVHTTDDDPVRMAVGPGYTGVSGGRDEPAWVDERVSLAEYAGRQVLLRFEYVTDGATHGRGWAVDDVRLETSAGAQELDDNQWRSEGWVRVDRPLAQSYVVRLIGEADDGTPVVMDVTLDAQQRGELRFDAGAVNDPIIAIAGSTEGTNQPARYTLRLLSSG